MPVTCAIHEGIALLTIELGQGNAINSSFIHALGSALDDAAVSAARALVITGQGRAFCGGLDLVTTYALDRPAMTDFVNAFDDLFLRVFTWPRPVVAAVNGFAIAGGAILAMAADYRTMQRGPYAIGINEVLLGIPFPSGALEIARHALPRSAWTAAFLEGKRYSPDEAATIGLVHELSEPEHLVRNALSRASALSAGGLTAIEATKADLLAPVLRRIETNRSFSRTRFVEQWFESDARERIGRLRDELLARRHKGQ